MALKRLSNNEVLLVCQNFIAGRGFSCSLNLDNNIKKYLLKYNYVYKNEESFDDLYFLDKKFYKNYKKDIEKLGLNRIVNALIKD